MIGFRTTRFYLIMHQRSLDGIHRDKLISLKSRLVFPLFSIHLFVIGLQMTWFCFIIKGSKATAKELRKQGTQWLVHWRKARLSFLSWIIPTKPQGPSGLKEFFTTVCAKSFAGRVSAPVANLRFWLNLRISCNPSTQNDSTERRRSSQIQTQRRQTHKPTRKSGP